MLRASLYFIQLALLIALAIWLSDNPGQVTIEWLGYRIDTYFAVVLAVVGMAAVVLVWLVRLLLRMLNAPGSFFAGRATRTREAGYKALMIGMAAVAAGDAAEAKRMSRRADSLLHDPSLTRLLQAQAAALNGDAEAATRYFQALRQDADTAFLATRSTTATARRRCGSLRRRTPRTSARPPSWKPCSTCRSAPAAGARRRPPCSRRCAAASSPRPRAARTAPRS